MSESFIIMDSLKLAELLGNALPEAGLFDRNLMGDANPVTLLNFDQKLGHLYEDALEELIKNSPSLDLITSHLQIFDDDKRTLGELDYVVFDKARRKYLHLELAVKFYLGIETEAGWQFPGPDQRDNWQRKLSHMQGHQLILSKSTEARALLKTQFEIDEIDVQQLVYGRLFNPYAVPDMPLPAGISNNAHTGQWIYVHQWEEVMEGVVEAFYLPKYLWPAMINEDIYSYLDSIHIQKLKSLAQDRCVMFLLKNSFEPWFLVPNAWGTNL